MKAPSGYRGKKSHGVVEDAVLNKAVGAVRTFGAPGGAFLWPEPIDGRPISRRDQITSGSSKGGRGGNNLVQAAGTKNVVMPHVARAREVAVDDVPAVGRGRVPARMPTWITESVAGSRARASAAPQRSGVLPRVVARGLAKQRRRRREMPGKTRQTPVVAGSRS